MKKANYNIYSMSERIKNIIFLIKSRLFFPGSRLIRFPFIVRGKNCIDFGKNLTTGYNCRFDAGLCEQGVKRIILGENVTIGDNVLISSCSMVKIGSNVLVGSRVTIVANSHGKYEGENQDSPLIPPNKRKIVSSEINIGDNVWIGDGVVIQKGVNIGKGSIIGANSVVAKDIPENVFAAGCPAKIIKRYDFETKEWNTMTSDTSNSK